MKSLFLGIFLEVVIVVIMTISDGHNDNNDGSDGHQGDDYLFGEMTRSLLGRLGIVTNIRGHHARISFQNAVNSDKADSKN